MKAFIWPSRARVLGPALVRKPWAELPGPLLTKRSRWRLLSCWACLLSWPMGLEVEHSAPPERNDIVFKVCVFAKGAVVSISDGRVETD